jgi:hypothetical protein
MPSAGSVVGSAGLTAEGIRGCLMTLSTGEALRPDFVLLDDPQSRESAHSPVQNRMREALVSADILGLAGPGESISAVMPCTVIAPGDFVDRMLDRKVHPAWRGERARMLKAMPTDLAEWDRYFDVYRRCIQQEPPDLAQANALYLARRAALDAGAEASWPARKLDAEVSAIQHAMHLYCRSRQSFLAEYQNAPEVEEAVLGELRQLTEADLDRKLNRLARGVVPREANRLTAFVDVQAEVLYWAVCAWTDRFGGALVDYGAWPAQAKAVFEAATPTPGLSELFPTLERGARIYAGLAQLVPALFGRTYRQDGTDGTLTVALCLVDQGFETETIHEYIGRSPYRAMLKPSAGRGIGAASKPLNRYRKEPGDLVGWNWRIDARPTAKGKHIGFDTNGWKSYVAEAILAPAGAAGSFYLFGSNLQVDHPLLTVHLLSEYRTPTFGQGRRVEEWRMRANNKENHWFDGVVGAAVAASVTGLAWTPTGEPTEVAPKPPPLRYAEVAARRGPAAGADRPATYADVVRGRAGGR